MSGSNIFSPSPSSSPQRKRIVGASNNFIFSSSRKLEYSNGRAEKSKTVCRTCSRKINCRKRVNRSSDCVTAPSFSFSLQSENSTLTEEVIKVMDENGPNITNLSSSPVKEATKTRPLPLTVVSRVLHGIPQNPHFIQFQKYTEATKKNLMSGWDNTFEEAVKDIRCLQRIENVDGFWVKAKTLWRTLEELQCMGYNVILLRRGLVEITDEVIVFRAHQVEIKRLRIKAENHRMEKCRLEFMAKVERLTMEALIAEAAEREKELAKFSVVLGNF